jgi:hypothetical protein
VEDEADDAGGAPGGSCDAVDDSVESSGPALALVAETGSDPVLARPMRAILRSVIKRGIKTKMNQTCGENRIPKIIASPPT